MGYYTFLTYNKLIYTTMFYTPTHSLMNSLIDILLINFTPNLLRLLIIPIFIFAAILDYKKRIVYNQIWVPAIGLLLVVLLWDFIILTTQSSDTITHYLHSLSLSIILGPSIAYMLYNTNTIGGADVKAIIYLSFFFPQTPSIQTFNSTIPLYPGTTPIFSMTILINAIVISLTYRIYILYKNITHPNQTTLSSKSYMESVSSLSDKHGFIKITKNGEEKEIDLNTIQHHLSTNNQPEHTSSQNKLSSNKHIQSLTQTITTALHQLQHTIIQSLPIQTSNPPLKHSQKNPNSSPKQQTNDVESIKTKLKEKQYIRFSPAIPFFIPLTISLIISLTHGSILYSVIEYVITILFNI